MRTFDGLAEFEKAVGTHLGYSDWHTITQEQIDMFATATGDDQWIHTDPIRAASGPFGATIAHGFLTLSLIPMLTSQVYAVQGLAMGVNYGLDKARFPSPAVVGSRVRAGVELTSVAPATLGKQALSTVTMELEGSNKPACVAQCLALLVP